MSHGLMRAVEPLVNHGLAELRSGAPAAHVLKEVTIAAIMVGAGATPDEALRKVEKKEARRGQMGPWEAAETQCHPWLAGAGMGWPTGYGRARAPVGYGGAMPMGYGAGMMPMGYGGGMPMGYGPGMMPMGYGGAMPMGYGMPRMTTSPTGTVFITY